MLKICKACRTAKPLTEFYKNQDGVHARGPRCKACMRVHTAAYYQRNKSACNAAVARWRRKNPDKSLAISRRDYVRNVEMHRLRTILRSKGLTLDQYHSIAESQDFCCYLCGEFRPLHVDHDHATGRVRRMLCMECNTSIGKLKDDPALLRRAADYIERYSCAR
jgi:hypothetical protein